MELKLSKEQIDMILKCLDAVIRNGGAKVAAVILPIIQDIENQTKELKE